MSKTVDGVEHQYIFDGTQLLRESWGNNWVEYYYDENGVPSYMLRYDERVGFLQLSFFVTNLQGDVIAMCDTTHALRFFYHYDAWGKLLSVTDVNGNVVTSTDNSAGWNTLLYRGYVYDRETGLYYVSSRYYDPEIGRMISPDSAEILMASPSALTDKNLYAYCDNNPVVRVDYGGQLWETVFDVISLGASIVEVCVNPTDPWAWAGLAGDAIDLIPFVTGVGEVT